MTFPELGLGQALVRFRLQRARLNSVVLKELTGTDGEIPWPLPVAVSAQLPPRVQGRLNKESDGQVERRLHDAVARGYRPVAGEAFARFLGLPQPPLVVLMRGELQLGDAVAIVGARQCSAYGRRMARRFGGALATQGISVISGLARGIDGEAHRGALERGGHTVAVLGYGPDRAYPAEHAALLREIEERGAVVSEHLPGVPPRPYHFPQRNRLLVALAQALLVIESRIKSGTLTSVRWAADLGRDVLVLPGPVDSPLGEGPLTLLREGATPVGDIAHILEALGRDLAGGAPSSSNRNDTVSPQEERVLAVLSSEALPLDELVRLLGEPPGRVLTLLLSLEVRGVLGRDEAMAYRVL